MRQCRVPIPKAAIDDFCRRHSIRRLSIFGSALREDFSPKSDLDILIEFATGREVGLIRLTAMQRELSEICGRTVDLRTPEDLSRYFRDKVVAEAEVQYAGS